MRFNETSEYAFRCGAAGVGLVNAERIATLARRVWRHAEAGCNRSITPAEECADRKARAELVTLGCELDDTALTTVKIVSVDGVKLEREIRVPVRG